MRTIVVTGDPLGIDEVVDVARGSARAEIGPDVAARMEHSGALSPMRSSATRSCTA